MKQILSSGHYYSFDKDNTYEPVMQVSLLNHNLFHKTTIKAYDRVAHFFRFFNNKQE